MKTESQRLKKNQESLESYNWYKAHHICVRCNNAAAASGSIYCQPCRAKALKTQKEWDNKNPTRKEEYLKKAKVKRTEWAAAGLCSRCGRDREDKRFKTCLFCRRGVRIKCNR